LLENYAGRTSAEREAIVDPHTALIEAIEDDTRRTAHWTGRRHLNPRVLAALRKVRRHAFVPEAARDVAYVNAPLAIGHGQTISQPFIVALMTDLLDLQPHDNVLEVGTGSGYQAAVLAELTDRVCSIEIIPDLAQHAAVGLAAEGYEAIALRAGDGAAGWPERAPFDAIIVTAAARDVPPALVDQLAPGGKLAIPIGAPYAEQELRLLAKSQQGKLTSRSILSVAFVPLTGGIAN
jgi:protein-L-isoaspartate(D-aspartate) O-methyltransferase